MPRRRCVGCGRIAPKSELLRVGLAGEAGKRPRRAVSDLQRRMPGRGAYLCLGEEPGLPAQACLAQALRRNAIPRALRCTVTLDPKLVESVSR